jgi:hypothetical protein
MPFLILSPRIVFIYAHCINVKILFLEDNFICLGDNKNLIFICKIDEEILWNMTFQVKYFRGLKK